MMSPTWTGARKVISSIAAVTAGPPLWRCATAPAVESASFMISPPCTLPSRLASLEWAMIPRLTRLYDVGRPRSMRSLMARTVASSPMADRPQGSGVPEKGTPEYDWLYGSQSKNPPSDATQRVEAQQQGGRADETRVMPVARREARGSGGQPPPGTGRTPATAPPPRPKKKRRWRPRLGLIPLVLILLLVYLLGVPLYHWTKIDKVDAAPSGDRPGDQPGTNYLIVGSDKADDLTDEQRKSLQTGERGGTNTDTIIVLHTGS